MTSAAYLEPVQIVALCADVGDDAGGQNEELHHLQGLLLTQRQGISAGLISALHHRWLEYRTDGSLFLKPLFYSPVTTQQQVFTKKFWTLNCGFYLLKFLLCACVDC